jgi:hypothetical protein
MYLLQTRVHDIKAGIAGLAPLLQLRQKIHIHFTGLSDYDFYSESPESLDSNPTFEGSHYENKITRSATVVFSGQLYHPTQACLWT